MEYDETLGEELKADGMFRAALARQDLLLVARRIAARLALDHPHRLCDADEVGKVWSQLDLPDLGPAAGSIFADRSQWRFTGVRRASKRVANHGREIKVWEYIGGFIPRSTPAPEQEVVRQGSLPLED